nr:ribulokinase [Sabulibacter ruber]
MKMDEKHYVIGVDYGTDSVRAIIVDAISGVEVASSTFSYPRWKEGLYCNATTNQFRQHPLDYVEGLENTITDCLRLAGASVQQNIRAISIDTTGSTPVAVDAAGIPLALHPAFQENPNAMFVLWKDHTSVQEAAEINAHAQHFETNYLQYVGGIYSSEWFWAKLLHVLREDPAVRDASYTWVEHCDWMPFLLTGGKNASEIKRNICSAGHKALWAEEFGGFPPEDFFASLDPLLAGFAARMQGPVYTSDKPAGQLCQKWAERLGLSTDVLVGIGAMDAHMGAVGGEIEPFYLSKVMGTSTCDMLVAPTQTIGNMTVKGICGQVNGSIIPGLIGMEAGQSAFGDIYAWFAKLLAWPLQNLLKQSELIDADTATKLVKEASERMLSVLNQQAAQVPFDINSELAIDWFNGRRTPDANQTLKGAIQNLSLGSDAPRVFRALVEATCFGAKKIIDRFVEEGVPVKGLIGVGGVAKKSPFIMQMMADVTGMPIKIHKSEQTCALGAAMFAATVAGLYPSVQDAMQAIGQGFDKEYYPDPQKTELFAARYQKYNELCRYVEFSHSVEVETPVST